MPRGSTDAVAPSNSPGWQCTRHLAHTSTAHSHLFESVHSLPDRRMTRAPERADRRSRQPRLVKRRALCRPGTSQCVYLKLTFMEAMTHRQRFGESEPFIRFTISPLGGDQLGEAQSENHLIVGGQRTRSGIQAADGRLNMICLGTQQVPCVAFRPRSGVPLGPLGQHPLAPGTSRDDHLCSLVGATDRLGEHTEHTAERRRGNPW